MLALGVFQALLNSIGWLLAKIYDLVGDFGVSIIILTILIRVVLLPLGIKQIKSMQAMQAIQPKVKELQKKYKGNKQRIQEEQMKLYKEAGVNPLGGCLPLLLQFPLLIAMYAVIRPPQLVPVTVDNQPAYEIHNNHLPVDSKLFQNVILHQSVSFVGLGLQCSAAQSGTQAAVVGTDRKPVSQNIPIVDTGNQPLSFKATTGNGTIPCGSKPVDKIPYFVLLAFMVATTFYQQRQMQKASPPGASSGQQQAIMRIMPIMFGVFGYAFPAGLTLYWTVANLWQIGQQYVLLRAGHIGPEALERRMAEQRAKGDTPTRPGLIARMQERAEAERKRREQGSGRSRAPRGGSGSTKSGPRPKPKPSNPSSGQDKRSSGSSGTGGSGRSGTGTGRPGPGASGSPADGETGDGRSAGGSRGGRSGRSGRSGGTGGGGPRSNRRRPGPGGGGDKGDGEASP